MYSLEIVIAIGLAAALVGLAAGFLFARHTAPGEKSRRQMETRLQELQEQQQDYQQQVSEHFVGTAQLLNQLTGSYRDVHNHLAKGARTLAGDNDNSSLVTLPDTTHSEQDQAASPEEVNPPLDYAPKTAADAPGMLNEEFGLDKTNSHAQQTEAPLTGDDAK